LQPALSDAAFPERNGSRPYRHGGPNLSAASGIAASHLYPGVFWLTRDGFGTHDDPVLRGYRSFLYAIRFDAAQGRLLPWAGGVPQTSCDGLLEPAGPPPAAGQLRAAVRRRRRPLRGGQELPGERRPGAGGGAAPADRTRPGRRGHGRGAGGAAAARLLRPLGRQQPAQRRGPARRRRGEACGNEAIGWLPASGSPSFLAVSEAGLVRWWPG
jgi:hypothetical protein